MQSDPNSDSLSGETHVDSSDGAGAVDSNTFTLDEMNSFLGKDFKDKDSALEAVRNTFSFVGKRKEDIAAELRASGAVTPQNASETVSKSELISLKKDLFYTQHPEYKEYADVIDKMGGSDPAEVVGTAEFKKIFAKVQVADAADSARSIVSSSPRLAQTKTVIDSAVDIANARGASASTVAETLAKGIAEQMSQE